MKVILISGPDGVGKSTICTKLMDYYSEQKLSVLVKWLRFNHMLAKLVNVLGRLTGKSYYEHHSWGKVGYHNYHGAIGYLYIIAVYLDHIIFRLFSRKKIFENTDNDVLIVDRYIIDIMADLIVDTGKNDLVVRVFQKYALRDLGTSKAFILVCDPEIVMTRRDDIIDDKSYNKKIEAYKFLSESFGIETIDTGVNQPNQVIDIISKAS